MLPDQSFNHIRKVAPTAQERASHAGRCHAFPVSLCISNVFVLRVFLCGCLHRHNKINMCIQWHLFASQWLGPVWAYCAGHSTIHSPSAETAMALAAVLLSGEGGVVSILLLLVAHPFNSSVRQRRFMKLSFDHPPKQTHLLSAGGASCHRI